jgi:chromosome condensin MukBEF ATPase and DNA-binding subunit MukB
MKVGIIVQPKKIFKYLKFTRKSLRERKEVISSNKVPDIIKKDLKKDRNKICYIVRTFL